MDGLSQELGLQQQLERGDVGSCSSLVCLHHLLLAPGRLELMLNAESSQCHGREIKRESARLAAALPSARR